MKLVLTQAMGKVRIADNSGNHIRKPTEGKNESNNFVEWMITNNEIKELVNLYLDVEDKRKLKSKIEAVNNFLKNSKFYSRSAKKEELKENFLGFSIFKYSEEFYSFEKKLDSNIVLRLTFKMGDYTLAVHMFVLLPFSCRSVVLKNLRGVLSENEKLGSGAYAIWIPDKDDIISIMEGLAHASENHKRDLMGMLQ